ncbi:MAG: hypothetical protein U0V74_03410 [Chitinophagales bacterium]
MDPLHQIIQSLNKAEKRYFRLFSTSFKSDSDILKLYDVLEDLPEYDEEVVKKRSGIKNLTASKSQLRRLLLKAMRNYREEDNVADRVRCALSEIEFLTNKNLKVEARKEINKLQKIAVDYEINYALAELSVRSVMNAEAEKDREKFFAFFAQKRKDLEEGARGMIEYYEATIFHTMVIRYANLFDYENPALRKETVDGFRQKAEQKLAEVKSVRAKCFYLGVLADYYYNTADEENTLKQHQAILDLFDEDPSLYESPKTFYFTQLSNYIVSALKFERFELVEELLAKIEKWAEGQQEFYKINPDLESRVKVRILSTRGSLAHMRGDYKGALLIEKDLDDLLNDEGIVTSAFNVALIPIMVMRHCATLLMGGYFDKTHYWIERYYKLPTAKANKMLYLTVRILEVFMYYNQGELALADTKATNLYKALMETEVNDPFFKEFGKLLRKLCKWNFKEEKDRKECDAIITAIEGQIDNISAAGLFDSVYSLRKWFNDVVNIKGN